MRALKHFYNDLGEKIWGEYGFRDAFNETKNWYAQSYLAIDEGPIVAMIENYRSGLLWKLFMTCPEIQRGLKKLGFSSPWYKMKSNLRTFWSGKSNNGYPYPSSSKNSSMNRKSFFPALLIVSVGSLYGSEKKFCHYFPRFHRSRRNCRETFPTPHCWRLYSGKPFAISGILRIR